MATNRMRGDPDAGIPDLIARLSDDSKRLIGDEVRLAKLELRANVSRGGKGAMWFGVAFGLGVIAAAAFTLLLATLIGRLVGGHMWIGAMVTGLLEIGVAVMLVKRGLGIFTEPSYSLEQTRDSLRRIT